MLTGQSREVGKNGALPSEISFILGTQLLHKSRSVCTVTWICITYVTDTPTAVFVPPILCMHYYFLAVSSLVGYSFQVTYETYVNNSIHNSTVDVHHIFHILKTSSFLKRRWRIYQLIQFPARCSARVVVYNNNETNTI